MHIWFVLHGLVVSWDQLSLGHLNTLQWRYNEHDGVSNHQPHDCLFRHISKKTSKLRVTGLCEGNSPVTVEFPTQRASNVGNISIWWRSSWTYRGWVKHVDLNKSSHHWFRLWLAITVTSLWARWRLKSPASRLFAQRFVHALIKENIKAPSRWPLWGESTGDQCIPSQRVSNA